MRFSAFLVVIIGLLSAPVAGLGIPPDTPDLSIPVATNRWVEWYEEATGLPVPAVLVTLGPALDELLPREPRDEDESPEVHVGWMRNYCNTVLHDDCVYNDPTGHSYDCGPNHIGVNQGLTIWDSDPGIVLMNHTFYGTYTEAWLGLGAGGEARHVVLVGTNCHATLFSDTYVNTSGIGFYFPN